MNRREILAAAGGLVAAGCEKSLPVPAGPDPLIGAALMHDVSVYTAFGTHRSGSSGDIATSSWISDRWKSLGYEVEQTSFETPNCDTFRANVTIDDNPLDGFGQPPVVHTPEGGLKAQLVMWDPAAAPAAAGKIAVVHVPRAAGAATPAGAYRAAFVAAEKAGAAGVVALMSGPSGEIAAMNTPIDMTAKIPVLVLGEGGKPLFDAAIKAKKEAVLRIEGEGGTRTAKNTVARFGKSGKWLIVSTPQSGWFTCGGERGPGIAIALALSDWVLRQKFDNRILFTSNSGHEWLYHGAKIFHEKSAPKAEDTAMWFHLGASFGARAYDESGPKLVPLATPCTLRTLMVSGDIEARTKAAFAGQPQLSEPLVGNEQNSLGELTDVIKEGYKTYAGFYGFNALFHTPYDDEESTTPEIMEPIARSCAKLIESVLKKA